jgi:hypothetical protein
VPHFLFNFTTGDAENAATRREQASELMRLGMWGVDAGERHRDALARGDHVLIYLGAPEREFIGRAVLASAPHAWTAAEADAYPGDSAAGVLLAEVEAWEPPVPVSAVLARLDSNAKADFGSGVVLITAHEYETALAVAAN